MRQKEGVYNGGAFCRENGVKMGEFFKPVPEKQHSTPLKEAWKERPDAGFWSPQRALGAFVAAAVITIPVGGMYKAYDEARRANYMEEHPNGMLPKLRDGESITPFIELEPEGKIHIDFGKMMNSIRIERFEATHDVEVGSALITHDADTVSDFEIKPGFTVGMLNKEITIPSPLPAFKYEVNNEFNSVQRQQFFVPAEAVKGAKFNDKTYVTINLGELESYTSYVNPPTIRPYTIDADGQKDFAHPSGVMEAFVAATAATGAGSDSLLKRFNEIMPGNFDITSFKGFSNLQIEVNQMRADDQKYLYDALLDITNNSCKDSFDDELKASIKTGYIDAAVKQFGVNPDDLTVKLVGDVKVTDHYEDPAPFTPTVEPSLAKKEDGPGTITAASKVTNMPKEALEKQVDCDNTSFEVVKGGSNA